MIRIKRIAKIDNNFYFFAEDREKALSEQDVLDLLKVGCVNITEEQFSRIVKL